MQSVDFGIYVAYGLVIFFLLRRTGFTSQQFFNKKKESEWIEMLGLGKYVAK